ncbi:hypothetical protein VNO77_03710 [Canavalia gladiata]|uniref:Uncharacterized protein n=1 Tax=Canavalia gladiata TaxID=3824 RepID=A0AAN9R8E0_CANGL
MDTSIWIEFNARLLSILNDLANESSQVPTSQTLAENAKVPLISPSHVDHLIRVSCGSSGFATEPSVHYGNCKARRQRTSEIIAPNEAMRVLDFRID